MSNLFRALSRFELFRIMRDVPPLRAAAHAELRSRPYYFVLREES